MLTVNMLRKNGKHKTIKYLKKKKKKHKIFIIYDEKK